jgi:hypothetical protein
MNRRALGAPLALVGLVLAVLLSCTKPRTQIILLVDTDMAQGPTGTLTHVRITVKNGTTGEVRQRLTYPLLRVVNGQTVELPATLGIAAANNDAHSVEVNIDAVSDPGGDGTARAPLFTYYAIAPFEEERTKLLSVFLADRCRVLARDCLPDETCGLAGCMPRTVGTLPDVGPDFRFDAGERDGAANDATGDTTGDGVAGDLGDVGDDAAGRDAGDDLNGATDSASDLGGVSDGASDLGPGDASGACPATQRRCGDVCVDTASDPLHCGACGAACSTNHATPSCRAGACRLVCAADFGDCDGNPANGCEAALTSITNCGACASNCALPGVSTQACVDGSCAIGACATGRGDCDRVTLNGCETDTTSDGAHCGACGRPCASGMVCNGGVCAIACSTGRVACGGACVDPRTNAAHCGACGNVCPARTNATPACASSACTFFCNPNAGDCDGNPANGCESSFSANTSCGGCGRVCTALNATSTCAGGACGFNCIAGFGDCDGNPANGCEVNLSNSAAHCGACGAVCTLPHATATCARSACAIAACDAGFADCDGNPTNGCEVDTQTSAAHCGRCGQVCTFTNAAGACVAGACAIGACSALFGNCNGLAADGCETNLNTSNQHCGACGSPCAAGSVCSAGRCGSTCGAGTVMCAVGCVNTTNNPDHCGVCGNACPTPPNATRTCVSSACSYACLTGFADCNRTSTDGCERSVNTDPANCGGCGITCVTPANSVPRCNAGTCSFTCLAGFADCDRIASNGCELRVGGPCSDGCSPGVFACGATGLVCSTTTLACGATCTLGGVMGVCSPTGVCSTIPVSCTDGGAPGDAIVSSDRGMGSTDAF